MVIHSFIHSTKIDNIEGFALSQEGNPLTVAHCASYNVSFLDFSQLDYQ